MKEDILNQDLEEMRAQLALLNKKLENETIINEKLMKGVMQDKVNSINRDIVWEALGGLVGIPCYLLIWYVWNLSAAFLLVTILYFLLSVVFTYYTRRGISTEAVINGNLIELSAKLVKMKRMSALWLRYSIPFLIIWFVWIGYELSGTDGMQILLSGGIIGGAIGGWVGYKQYKKTQKNAQDIIDSIKELTKEEEQ